jgi:hypothetical protein
MIDYLLIALIAVAVVIVTIVLIKSKRASAGCASGCAGCSKAGQCSAFIDFDSIDRKIDKPCADSPEKPIDGKLHL